MHGLDVIGADPALGISWGDVGDVGKAAFPYVHATGKGIATAFGAGQAAQALENIEQKQGWLPPTADTASVTSSAQAVTTAATPKLRAAAAKVSPKPQPKPQPTTAPVTPSGETTTPAPTQQLSRTVVIVGTVGFLGIVALLLRHLWSAR